MTLSKLTYFDPVLLSLSILYLVSIYNNQLQSITTYAILILGETRGAWVGSDLLLPFKVLTLQRLVVSQLVPCQGRGLVRPFTIIHHNTHKTPFTINQLMRNSNKKFAGSAIGRRGPTTTEQKMSRGGDLVNINY